MVGFSFLSLAQIAVATHMNVTFHFRVLDTNKPNETQCTILEKSHESTWKDVMDILHRNFCPLPCVTMTVRFAGIEFIDIP